MITELGTVCVESLGPVGDVLCRVGLGLYD